MTSNLKKVQRALSLEIDRYITRIQEDLSIEASPDTTNELLEDWERAAGIPDGTRPRVEDLATRRIELTRTITYNDRPSESNIIALAAELNYIIEIFNNYQPFISGSSAGAYLTNDGEPKPTSDEGGWQNTIKVTYQSADDDTELEALVRKYVSADQAIIFSKTMFERDQLFTHDLNDAVYGGGTWVCVGDSGKIISSENNGLSWTDRTSGTANNLETVTYDGSGLFCTAGASGTILTSSDGISWVSRTADGSFAGTFHGSGHDRSGLFLLCGTSGELQSSANGTTWAAQTADGSYSGTFMGCEHDRSGLWVACGTSEELQSSVNGSTWVARTPGGSYTGDFENVTYDGTTWYVCGDTTEVQTSTNGTTYTSGTISAATGTIKGISADRGTRVWAAALNGDVFFSDDSAVTWTEHDTMENIFFDKDGVTNVLNSVASDELGYSCLVGDNRTEWGSLIWMAYRDVS